MLTVADIEAGRAFAGPIVAEFADIDDAGAFQRIKGAGFAVTPGVHRTYAVRRIVPQIVLPVDQPAKAL